MVKESEKIKVVMKFAMAFKSARQKIFGTPESDGTFHNISPSPPRYVAFLLLLLAPWVC
jgi:hypothetical protein